MPLGDIEPFVHWITREAPSLAAQRIARSFLDEIAEESWRAPSIPIAELSDQPEYEVREAALHVRGEDRPVVLWYRHIYATDVVHVIAITNL